jgi:anti-sigma factor RsiW
LYQDLSNSTISPAAGKVVNVALEVPLGALAVGRLLQGDHACSTRVEVFHEAFDGATLARGVAALEHDDMPMAVRLAPLLQLQQFDLQQPLLLLVLVAPHAVVVGVVSRQVSTGTPSTFSSTGSSSSSSWTR